MCRLIHNSISGEQSVNLLTQSILNQRINLKKLGSKEFALDPNKMEDIHLKYKGIISFSAKCCNEIPVFVKLFIADDFSFLCSGGTIR